MRVKSLCGLHQVLVVPPAWSRGSGSQSKCSTGSLGLAKTFKTIKSHHQRGKLRLERNWDPPSTVPTLSGVIGPWQHHWPMAICQGTGRSNRLVFLVDTEDEDGQLPAPRSHLHPMLGGERQVMERG